MMTIEKDQEMVKLKYCRTSSPELSYISVGVSADRGSNYYLFIVANAMDLFVGWTNAHPTRNPQVSARLDGSLTPSLHLGWSLAQQAGR